MNSIQSQENVRRSSARKIKERIDRATLVVGVASTFVAVVAAAAALWTGYEAHKTRIDDERPFVGVDLTAWQGELEFPGDIRGGASAPHIVAF